eukprot:TRINITY_DN16949_c0_g1_i1.p1 TRINITY_DN16949_c0_g1~~TRINITY_DN16949_c0_g1_i1.p1  ORF type:complete len:188 (+),score=59.56 TRINITY_DN16949_c0_g1_i1:138-701(+)
MEDSCLDSPRRLSDISLEAIVNQFGDLPVGSGRLHVPAAESLFSAFSEAGKLSDEVLLSELFPPTGLRYLTAPKAEDISAQGLEILRKHPDLSVIKMQGLQMATVKDLLLSLHVKTLQTLKFLAFPPRPFSHPMGKGLGEPVPFERLRSLVYLNVSGTGNRESVWGSSRGLWTASRSSGGESLFGFL